MPDIEITQAARFWNLHTEALIDEAASEIWHSPNEAVAVQVFREWSPAGQSTMRMVVVGAGQVFATAEQGTTLLRTPAGWEVLTDEQAAVRGIPLPTTPDS